MHGKDFLDGWPTRVTLRESNRADQGDLLVFFSVRYLVFMWEV